MIIPDNPPRPSSELERKGAPSQETPLKVALITSKLYKLIPTRYAPFTPYITAPFGSDPFNAPDSTK